MTGFVAIAALIALTVFAFVLRPLWRDGPMATAASAVVLMLTGLGLYMLLGTPAGLDPVVQKSPATLQDAVAQLEAALQRDPGQVEGWRLLGRAYASNQQPDKARDAYARAAALAPDQPDVLVEAAEARALADPQRHFDGKAIALLQHAVQLQPQQQRARWFLGIAQRQAGLSAEAAKTWEPLLAEVDAGTAAPLRQQIEIARKEAGLPPLPVAHEAQGLRVKVVLDPQLASRVRLRGDASVFVIARVPNGPPMPVAVEKHSVQELPFTATLDDSDGPMPTQRISALQDVEVFARLSMSGNAMRQADDIESPPVRVSLPSDKLVTLTLGEVGK